MKRYGRTIWRKQIFLLLTWSWCKCLFFIYSKDRSRKDAACPQILPVVHESRRVNFKMHRDADTKGRRRPRGQWQCWCKTAGANYPWEVLLINALVKLRSLMGNERRSEMRAGDSGASVSHRCTGWHIKLGTRKPRLCICVYARMHVRAYVRVCGCARAHTYSEQGECTTCSVRVRWE